MNAIKSRDSSHTVALTDGESHRIVNQSNTLALHKARKTVDVSIKNWKTNHRIQTTNLIVCSPNISTRDIRVDMIQPNENNVGCSANAGVDDSGVDNSGFQLLAGERSVNTIAPIAYTSDTAQSTSDRQIFARSRLQFPTCDYSDRFNHLNSNAHKMQHLPLVSSIPRRQHNCQSLPKDLTRYSICSAESEKTDYTDLSPMSPSTHYTFKDSICPPSIKCELQSIGHSDKDFTEAGCSTSTPSFQVYNSRDPRFSAENKRDMSNTGRPKILGEIHLRQTHSSDMNSNYYISTIVNKATDRDTSIVSSAHDTYEQRSLYQRPNYSFASTQTMTGHQNYNINFSSSDTVHGNISCSDDTNCINSDGNSIRDTLTHDVSALSASAATVSPSDMSDAPMNWATNGRKSLDANANGSEISELNIDLVRLTIARSTLSKDDVYTKPEWLNHDNGDRRL